MEQLLEYFGVITGFLYLLLEIRQHKAMWVVGFLTSLVYVFVFFFSKIYADMGLNIYYVAISIYGFKKWTCTKKSVTEEKVSDDLIFYRHITWPLLAGIASAILAIYVLLYYVLHNFTDSPIPMGDAFTTSVGIVATWMLAAVSSNTGSSGQSSISYPFIFITSVASIQPCFCTFATQYWPSSDISPGKRKE